MINAAIVGATGLSGQELQKILQQHTEVELKYTVGRQWQDVGVDIDLVFLALPHGAATDIAPHFLGKGIRVIDLSADFRHQTPELLSKIQNNVPDLIIEEWAYSLPELHRGKIDYQNIKLLANPGCYPTASLLALAPILLSKDNSSQLSDYQVIIDAKSGYSGAGKKFVESENLEKIKDNMWAYKIAGVHNHVKEIESQLGGLPISFTPHIMPFYSGLMTTCYVDLPIEAVTGHDLTIQEQYKSFYQNEKFVAVSEDIPTIKDIVQTNKCHIALKYDEHVQRLVVISAIDNLIKGAAGQAVQNMNLMFGVDEATGLI